MAITMNGVVRKTDGLLLRAGYCNFTVENTFDPLTQEQHADVPQPFYLVNDLNFPDSPTVTHWNGTGWDEVPRT